MATIPLTKGKSVVVDDADMDLVSKHIWKAHRATTKRENWYAYAMIDGRKVYLHRMLMNAPKGSDTDHIDGDGLNNRRSNLRVCSRSENNRNAVRHPNKCGAVGVQFHRQHNLFVAFLWFGKRRKRLGYFKTLEAAIEARRSAAEREYGGFARAAEAA